MQRFQIFLQLAVMEKYGSIAFVDSDLEISAKHHKILLKTSKAYFENLTQDVCARLECYTTAKCRH